MISRHFVIAGVLFASAFVATGVLPRAASDDKPGLKFSLPSATSSPTPGRFQIASASGQLFVLDTATGQVWKHAPKGKTDEHFFEAKSKDDPLADLSAKIGPTYQGIPLSYWLVMLRDEDEEFRTKLRESRR